MSDDLTTDRLVGVADLAQLVGRSQRTLGGWRARKVLPDSEIIVDTRGTLIWRASTVLAAMADRGFYTGPVPEPMPLPDLVSYKYVGELTDKDARSVQWLMDDRSSVRLPDPLLRLSTIPLWERRTIDEWAEAQKVAS